MKNNIKDKGKNPLSFFYTKKFIYRLLFYIFLFFIFFTLCYNSYISYKKYRGDIFEFKKI